MPSGNPWTYSVLNAGYSIKDHIQFRTGMRFYTEMKNNNGQASRERHAMDYAATAMEQMELYCTAHA